MRKPTLAISCESVRQIRAAYASDAALVEAALRVCVERFGRGKGSMLTNPSAVRDYLRLLLAPLEHEVFIGIFLDSQHRVITTEELFRGTLAQTSVYPREVVKRALVLNAGAVLFCHNHPGGVAEPSRADECLTATLKQALALVDVRVLDHFIVTANQVLSFAECGRL